MHWERFDQESKTARHGLEVDKDEEDSSDVVVYEAVIRSMVEGAINL